MQAENNLDTATTTYDVRLSIGTGPAEVFGWLTIATKDERVFHQYIADQTNSVRVTILGKMPTWDK
jgi:hypothetical protein